MFNSLYLVWEIIKGLILFDLFIYYYYVYSEGLFILLIKFYLLYCSIYNFKKKESICWNSCIMNKN